MLLAGIQKVCYLEGICKKPENTTDSNCSEVSDLRETPGAPGVLKLVDQPYICMLGGLIVHRWGAAEQLRSLKFALVVIMNTSDIDGFKREDVCGS
jgi:hypothetical protein